MVLWERARGQTLYCGHSHSRYCILQGLRRRGEDTVCDACRTAVVRAAEIEQAVLDIRESPVDFLCWGGVLLRQHWKDWQ